MKNVVGYQGLLKDLDLSGGSDGAEAATCRDLGAVRPRGRERGLEIGLDLGGEKGREGFYRKAGKRIFDLLLAVALLPLLGPLIAILWVLVRRDGGDGFFGHARIGRDGRRFKCWKIRTMVPGAEEKLQAYLRAHPAAAREWEANRKLANDPRITPIGHFLRRSSLDELPQLWNVFMGEMSFVGARPVTGDELGKYGPYAGSYLAQSPGVTGVWQVSGRNEVSYEARVAMDHAYLRDMSFGLDLKMLFKTWLVVIRRTGC